MSAADLGAELRAECERLDLPFDEAWLPGLNTHADLLRRWAPRVNLVSVGDLPHLVTRHLLDSLTMLALEPVRQASGAAIDIGSGAGFPGLPLAIARPDLDWTLLEPRKKRGAFLTQVIVAARLQGVRWRSGRLPDAALAGGFDLVVSRATFAPVELLEMVRPLLTPSGVAVIMAATPPEVSDDWVRLDERQMTIDGASRYVAAWAPAAGSVD